MIKTDKPVINGSWRWIAGITASIALMALAAIASITWEKVQTLDVRQSNIVGRVISVEKDIEYIRQTVTEIKQAVIGH